MTQNFLTWTPADVSQPFTPPGRSLQSLLARPFHVYDRDFVALLGPDPTLTRIAASVVDPLFHEAVVWSRSTDEMFFVQNAGAPDAGTGLAKSSIIQKISLADAAAAVTAAAARKKAGIFARNTLVPVTTVASSPQVINPNGHSLSFSFLFRLFHFSRPLLTRPQAAPTSAARSFLPARARATTSRQHSM